MGNPGRLKIILYKPVVFDPKRRLLQRKDSFKTHVVKDPEIDANTLLSYIFPRSSKIEVAPEEILSMQSQFVLIDTQLEYAKYFHEIAQKLYVMGIPCGLVTAPSNLLADKILEAIKPFTFTFFIELPLPFLEYKTAKKVAINAIKLTLEGNILPFTGTLTYSCIKPTNSIKKTIASLEFERFHFCLNLEKESKKLGQIDTLISCPIRWKDLIRSTFPESHILDGDEQSVTVVRTYWLLPKQLSSVEYLQSYDVKVSDHLEGKVIK